ncbi:MAG: hypothetical protein AAFU71_10065 [Cyanobacteria bacterium J06632_22]
MSRQAQSASALSLDVLSLDVLPLEAQPRIYVMDVYIVDGPIEPEFLHAHPMISRRIEILEHRTLADLHQAIFQAFDRRAEHLYEFQIGGKGPHDPKNRVYSLSQALRREEDEMAAGDVETTTLADAGICVDQPFGYWFDFGDAWWHQVNLVEIRANHCLEGFPKVVGRVGDSPPQQGSDED